MKEYRKHLASVGVPGNQAYHYMAWVRQYAEFCDDRSLDYWAEESLMSYLAENARLNEAWKMTQSEDAVRQYIYWRKGKREELYEGLLEKLSEVLRGEKKSLKTVELYSVWVSKFLKWSEKDQEWGFDDLEIYIKKLVSADQVALATQNQAVAALKYFFEKVLGIRLDSQIGKLRAKSKIRLPAIMSREEISEIFGYLDGVERLLARMLYGCGLRPGELYRLCVGDLDLEQEFLRIVDDSGKVKREVFLPKVLHKELDQHLKLVNEFFEMDKKLGLGDSWRNYYLFPAKNLTKTKGLSRLERQSFSERILRRKFNQVLDSLGLKGVYKLASFRASFAVHYLEDGGDVRTLQKVLGHHKVLNTIVYQQLAKFNCAKVKSPLDNL